MYGKQFLEALRGFKERHKIPPFVQLFTVPFAGVVRIFQDVNSSHRVLHFNQCHIWPLRKVTLEPDG